MSSATACAIRGPRSNPGANGRGRSCAPGSRSALRSRSPCSPPPGSSPACSLPDLTPVHIAGLTYPSEPDDMLPILWRNSLVLALHGTACIAGFIAGASMPIAAAQRTGFSRWIHVKAGEFAILFVCAVTLFSLSHPGALPRLPGLVDRLPAADHPPRTDPQRPPARDPGADRALPPARRLADRQPPRRVEPAAGGDLHHRDAGDSGADHRRRDRGLRLAADPPPALAGHLLAPRAEPAPTRRPRPRKIAAR